MSESLRIIFAGTPDFAARHLDALLSSGHNVVGVFTQPDRPAGRGKKLMPSPVKVLAEEKGLPVFQPVSLRPQENQQLVAELQADVMVRIAHWVAKQSHIDAVVLQQTGLTLRQAQRFLSFPRKSIESSLCWLE
ncbi:unnamed protein product, partial [marine sediment metagenome]